MNDILLDGAKVGGVLAYTQSQGKSRHFGGTGHWCQPETRPPGATYTLRSPRCHPYGISCPSGTKKFGLRASVFHALSRALDRNYGIAP